MQIMNLSRLAPVGSFEYLVHATLVLLGAAGVQNIIAVILLVLLIKGLVKNVKTKKYFRSVLAVLVCLFLSYSLFTRSGSIRLLCASYGYPAVAYSFPEEKIEIRSEMKYGLFRRETVRVLTGKRDAEDMPIMPTVCIYCIGPLYYARLEIFHG
ncbi:MAG: hypothetical protein IKE93_06175 [Erysipelotrichaceae bacterium]|nr:hypothetical protein [Erysipelotrichaceae bacterium]